MASRPPGDRHAYPATHPVRSRRDGLHSLFLHLDQPRRRPLLQGSGSARCEYEANIRIGDFQSTPAHDGDAAARDATPAAIARTKQRIIGECLQKTFHTSL